MIAHSTAAGEKNSPAAVLCVFVHKKLSFDFEGNRLFLPGYRLPILGKISDERFTKMSATYEAEQKTLDAEVFMIEQKLRDADKASVDLRMLLKGLREFTELKKLTPELVNTLIQRIEVHNSDRSGGKIRVKVDIYFTAIGIINLPTEKDMEKLITEYEEEHAEKERSKVAAS